MAPYIPAVAFHREERGVEGGGAEKSALRKNYPNRGAETRNW